MARRSDGRSCREKLGILDVPPCSADAEAPMNLPNAVPAAA
jgi:hypothetical protein